MAAGMGLPTPRGELVNRGLYSAVVSPSPDREMTGRGCPWTVALLGTFRRTVTVALYSWGDTGPGRRRLSLASGGPCSPSRPGSEALGAAGPLPCVLVRAADTLIQGLVSWQALTEHLAWVST